MFLAAQSGLLEASWERFLDYGILGIIVFGVLLAGWRLWPRVERWIDTHIDNSAKLADARLAREEQDELDETANAKSMRTALLAIPRQMEQIVQHMDKMSHDFSAALTKINERLERVEDVHVRQCDPISCPFAQATLDVQRANVVGRTLERRTDPLQEGT